MGGKALKEIETRRVDAEEYHQRLVPDLLVHLRTFLGTERRLAVIESYRDKADFGDVDVLVESKDDLPANWIDDAAKIFGSQQVVKNGGVNSMDFRGVQIDLIKTPSEEFDWTRRYFAFNDLGNLIGRIAHRMGFKFGHDGLAYVVRAPGKDEHVLTEVIVSRDWPKTLSYLGFSAERWERGFQNKREIFDYVTESTYFNREIYLLENRNHQSRVRDAKRPTYREFLVYCAEQRNLPAFQWAEKSAYLETSFSVFPGFKDAYMTALDDLKATRLTQTKFNGDIVANATGLTREALGERMTMLKRVMSENGKKEMHAIVAKLNTDELVLLVRQSDESSAKATLNALLPERRTSSVEKASETFKARTSRVS